MPNVLTQQEDVKKASTTRQIKGVKCEVFSRIVGYYRPVQDWNRGKQEEWKERHNHSEKDMVESLLRL
ncbi:MAG: anaerobic ribonucleoside-triphosphate reductase [Dehalococcoidia bacterium]|jgi:anaerobic ribonucleoside-triphosphate reductase